jgi:uncharacterized protein (TIRG00374 family)
MVVERVLDLLFIVTLLPFTLAEVSNLPGQVQAAARISGLIALIAIVVMIIAANQRPRAGRWISRILARLPFLDANAWSRRADDILAGLVSLTRPRDGLILLALSILTWLPIIAAYYAAMLAVNLQPTVAMAGFVVCAAALSITAPSSPGQVGVFHAGVTFALVQILGQPESESASFAFLYHALNFSLMVVLGLIGVYGASATFGSLIASTRGIARGANSAKA